MFDKVLLVNPNRMKPAVAPIALDYLASDLAEHNLKADILDLCFSDNWKQDIDEYFAYSSVVAIGVSLRNTDDTSISGQEFFIPKYKEIVNYIRERTSAPVVLGGAGFSIMPEAILEYFGLDFGIWGDGEYSFPLLIEKLLSNQSCNSVPGLIYRTDGGFRRNPSSYITMNIAPAPGREAVDNYRYFIEGGMGSIETKRGCNKRCIYCADPLCKGKFIRMRTPASVVNELESLLRTGIDHFHICDSEFNLPPFHAEEVCREIVRRELGDKLRWYTYASPAPFTEDMAILFQKAGCSGINFGVDSGNDIILRSLGRDFCADDLKHTAGICNRQGIAFMYDLLLGGPEETTETIRQSIEFMKELSPSRIGVALGVRIFPGTRLAGLVQEMGPLHQNPNLHGSISDHEQFFAPVFYLSSDIGEDASQYVANLIAGDERFLFMTPQHSSDRSYNYNENLVLVEAIQAGYRGAFWDILRRLSSDKSSTA